MIVLIKRQGIIDPIFHLVVGHVDGDDRLPQPTADIGLEIGACESWWHTSMYPPMRLEPSNIEGGGEVPWDRVRVIKTKIPDRHGIYPVFRNKSAKDGREKNLMWLVLTTSARYRAPRLD